MAGSRAMEGPVESFAALIVGPRNAVMQSDLGVKDNGNTMGTKKR